ncbi:MAG: zinc ribbon domain-containing protein [Clostridia bacterium]|nr:zinc ribbon domain-containing protein [Clostridia bacterium]
MNCKHCGAPLAEDSKFCSECGKTVEVTPTFCSNCGAELEADARFCRACGTATGKTESAPANTNNASQSSVGGDGVAFSVQASREVDRWFGGKFSRQAEGTNVSGDDAAKLSLMQILLSVCSVFTFLFYLFPSIWLKYPSSIGWFSYSYTKTNWSYAFFGVNLAEEANEPVFALFWTLGTLVLQALPLILAIVFTIRPLVKGTVLNKQKPVIQYIAAISAVVGLFFDVFVLMAGSGGDIQSVPNFWGFMLIFAATGMIVLSALIQSKKKNLGLQ